MASSTSDRYHAIVIGSGAAGLTCATRLAQAGLRTLLLEQNEWVGGYTHGSSQDGYSWDHGGHFFLAYGLGAQAREVFERLKLNERLEMVPNRSDYNCIFPTESLAIPAELTEAADILSSRFPAERDGIVKVLLTMESLAAEVDQFMPSFRVMGAPGSKQALDPVREVFQRPRVAGLASLLKSQSWTPGPNLLKYQTKTLQQLLDEYLQDPLLKGYFAQLSAGTGVGPGRLSAVIGSVFFSHALRTMWLPRGGFGKLAETLAELFQEQGGTLLTGARVTRLELRDERVGVVETADGRRFEALAVVSAADARDTFLDWLAPEHVPAELRDRLPLLDLTPSVFQVRLGVDMDLEPYRQNIKRLNFFYPSPDIDRAMANFPNGNPEEAAFLAYVATFHQPELAPPGKHTLKLEAYTTLNSKGISWERDKERLGDIFIRRAEALIPNLSQHIVTRAYRTPQDLLRDTGNSEGAFGGWAFTPELLSSGRPRQRTPVPGLFLAGHWTTPAAGVPWVMVSGYNAAGMVLHDLKRA